MQGIDREVTIEASNTREQYGMSVFSQFRRPYYETQAVRSQIGLPEQNIAEYIVDQIKAKGFHARRAELDAIFNSGC